MSDTGQPPEEILAAAAELLRHCDIADVRPSRISAELIVEGPQQVATVTFNPTLEFAAGPGFFRNRFTYSFSFEDVDEKPVATMEFVLVVEWSVSAEYGAPQDAAEFVATTTGYFAAFPYARELAQATTARLGLDPIVLGVLNRKELRPETIRVVVRPTISGKADEMAEPTVE